MCNILAHLPDTFVESKYKRGQDEIQFIHSYLSLSVRQEKKEACITHFCWRFGTRNPARQLSEMVKEMRYAPFTHRYGAITFI